MGRTKSVQRSRNMASNPVGDHNPFSVLQDNVPDPEQTLFAVTGTNVSLPLCKTAPKLLNTSTQPSVKRVKQDPPLPTLPSSPLSMELLLDEIRALKPYVEETNACLQQLKDNWSHLDNRVGQLETKVDSLQSTVVQISILQKQVENLENRNRRNNLRIYGLNQGLEGEQPYCLFSIFPSEAFRHSTFSIFEYPTSTPLMLCLSSGFFE